MKTSLKRAFLAAANRSYYAVWAAQIARFVSQTIIYLPSRRVALAYPSVADRINSDPAATLLNDHGTNFFTRVILEHHHDFVIELGAFTADRSLRLAKLFPHAKVYALDITRDFASERELNGVTLGPNNLLNIRAIGARHAGQRGLLCAHGTLAYYAVDDLAALFETAAALHLDVAFSEPNVSLTEQSRTVNFRRTAASYYQPYIHLLMRAGYRLPDASGQQVRDCWGRYAEERTFIFATQAT